MGAKVHVTGKLRPIDTYATLYDNCKFILSITGRLNTGPSHQTVEQQINSCYNFIDFAYIIINGGLYEIVERQDLTPSFSEYTASRNDDNTIDFDIKYYTSNLDFDKAIGLALESGS